MKVQDALNNSQSISGMHAKDDRKLSESRETGFQGQLKKVETRQFEERMHEMVDQIIRQGEKLARKVDVRELRIYKKMISDFLGEAVGSSFKFSKQSLLDRRGRHRVYANIKRINEEVEGLTKEILEGEKEHIKVLQRIEEIRGLILDIIM